MKNVTYSLGTGTSAALVPPRPANFFDRDDFTITIPAVYVGNWAPSGAAEQMAALEEAMKVAPSRGYTVDRWHSNDTMNDYVRFKRNRPA